MAATLRCRHVHLRRVGLFFSRWALGPQRHTSSYGLPGVKAWRRRIPFRSPEWLPQGSAYSTAGLWRPLCISAAAAHKPQNTQLAPARPRRADLVTLTMPRFLLSCGSACCCLSPPLLPPPPGQPPLPRQCGLLQTASHTRRDLVPYMTRGSMHDNITPQRLSTCARSQGVHGQGGQAKVAREVGHD